MSEVLSFLFFWILIMGLIGGVLLLVQKIKPKNEIKEEEEAE